MNKSTSSSDSVPQIDERLRHIAFIMDGNGRWAKKRSMPREYGHKAGASNFKKIVNYCGDIGIKIVTIYAFSTENWSRPKKEVDAIMKLLDEYLDECIRDMDVKNIRYHFLGDESIFAGAVLEKMTRVEELSKEKPLRLNVALNYGGRAELVHAFNTLAASGKKVVSENDISRCLYTSDCPDPDLIVRTAGEMRLSNFLLWQSAYSELYFTDVLWPDLGEKDVNEAIIDFYMRKRKFGGL